MEKYICTDQKPILILNENLEVVKEVKYTGEYKHLIRVTKSKIIAKLHSETEQLTNGYIALLDDIPKEALESACNSVKPQNWK